MIEPLLKASRECTKSEDIAPTKILRPIGTTFYEWVECKFTTELPHWLTWKVVGVIEEYKGRRGNTMLFERMNEIRLIDG